MSSPDYLMNEIVVNKHKVTGTVMFDKLLDPMSNGVNADKGKCSAVLSAPPPPRWTQMAMLKLESQLKPQKGGRAGMPTLLLLPRLCTTATITSTRLLAMSNTQRKIIQVKMAHLAGKAAGNCGVDTSCVSSRDVFAPIAVV